MKTLTFRHFRSLLAFCFLVVVVVVFVVVVVLVLVLVVVGGNKYYEDSTKVLICGIQS